VVEVELNQVVADAAGNDVAALIDVDDDGVAVVFERDRATDVVEFDGLECLVQVRAVNVDWRLLVAFRAGFVGRVELAPGERAALAFVVPRSGGLGGGKGGQAKQKSGKCRKANRLLTP